MDVSWVPDSRRARVGPRSTAGRESLVGLARLSK